MSIRHGAHNAGATAPSAVIRFVPMSSSPLKAALAVLPLVLFACGSPPPPAPPPPQPPPSGGPSGANPGGNLSMANPASKNCVDKGGKLEIRADAQGNESGVCLFPDGSSCDEWAFMNGKCAPGRR